MCELFRFLAGVLGQHEKQIEAVTDHSPKMGCFQHENPVVKGLRLSIANFFVAVVVSRFLVHKLAQ